jgi:hypothetical protein
MMKKNCFVKEKGKKESLSPVPVFFAKKQRNKRRGWERGCVYAGNFWQISNS